jgi:SulP family sulfate permease
VTAVAAALLVGGLGGSRVLISGPLVAFVALSFGIIQRYGFPALAAVTVLSGATMVFLGVLRIGCLVRFIPRAVIAGLSAGVAINVLVGALGPLFGLAVDGQHDGIIGAITSLALGLRFINPWSCALAAATLAIIAIVNRWFGRWMLSALIALVVGTLTVALFGIPVETVGLRDGAALLVIPSITIPRFDVENARVLFSSAMSLALLASVESLMGAAVADGITGERREPDRVLIAQGAANLVIPFIGGIPSGVWALPSVIAVRRGARSCVAAFTHALALLGLSVLLGRFVSFVPVPILASLVAFASFELIGLPAIRAIAREGKGDAIVFCATLCRFY